MKLGVDLREQPREVPGREILARWLRGLSALQESPAVVEKVVPIPVRQNRVQHRHDLLWCFRNRRLHADDFFLGFVPLDVAFENDLARDGFGRFAPGFVFQRALDDRVQFLDGRLWQTLADRFLNLLPRRLSRGGSDDRDNPDEGKEEKRREPFHELQHTRTGGWTEPLPKRSLLRNRGLISPDCFR